MEFFTSLMVLTLIVAGGVPYLQAKSDSPGLSYWEDKLPNTPIPNALLELIGKGKGDFSISIPHVVGGQYIYGVPANEEQILADPALSMYFLEKDLHIGTKMSLSLAQRSNGEQPYFLPRHVSEKIPFSSDKFSVALKDLNVPEGSEAALTMKASVEQCERPVDESKYCATSLESMIDYSTSRLGTNHVNVLGTNVPKNSMKQQYTFSSVLFMSKSTSESVVCHTQPYAYAVFYCHEPKDTKVVQVSLEGEDGSTAKGIGLCHEDTSWWNPKHLSFKLLNVKPGGPSVCHFIPEDEVIWVPAN